MQEYTFNVQQEPQVRLDTYLVRAFAERGLIFSRAFIQRLIRQGNVSVSPVRDSSAAVISNGVNGNTIKSHHKMRPGELIKVAVAPEPELKPRGENIPLEIIYEDEDLLVVNKPRGLVMHPAAGNLSGTLVNALLFHCPQLSTVNPDRPGIVHRLDKDTAGLLVVAKNNPAHLCLAKQFAEHSVRRIYTALVSGRVEFDEGVVDLPIGRHPVKREKMSVDFKDKGRTAYTRYKVIKYYRVQSGSGKGFTLLELTPHTGRTHQLRVHMAALGHPILGDVIYGQNVHPALKTGCALKLALYAKYLGFRHPKTGKDVEFEHPLAEDMLALIAECRMQNEIQTITS